MFRLTPWARWIEGGLKHRRLPFAVASLAVLLCLPALRMGFFADDYMHRATFLQPTGLEGIFGKPFADLFSFADGDPERMGRIVDRGMLPWMTYPGSKIRFWRPVTVATHWLDYQLWPDSAVLMHVHNLLWFGGSVAAVGFFYRRMMGPGLLAGLAALLFAIDDTHGWPAAWIANRNGPIALLLCVFVLILHDRWRREGQRSAAILGTVIFAIALLAKESSISAFGYLFAYALFLDKGPIRSRVLSLVPYGLVVATWRICYVYLGFGAGGSGGYIDPVESPIAFLSALATRAPLLLHGQWWFPPSDYHTLGPPSFQPYFLAIAVAGTIALIPLLLPLVRRNATARFWCLGMLLSLIPASVGDPQDRLLLFSGLGAMGLLAQFFVEFRSNNLFNATSRLRKWFIQPAFYVLAFVHLVLAPVGLTLVILTLTWVNDNTIMAAQDTLPENHAIENKTFVFMNASNYPVGSYLFIIRGLEGRPTPAHLRSLAPAMMAVVPIRISRPDEDTLIVKPEGGYPWSAFRDSGHPLAVGEMITLTGMTAEVLTLTEGGWPESAAYHFERELEDPSLVWFLTIGVNFVEVDPPTVGETIVYDPIRLLRETQN